MRRNTPKRARQEREYTKLRRVFLASSPWCTYPDCGHPATEVHHRRGRVGALLTAVEHWSPLCHGHHVFVTEHPSEALAMGLSESRLGGAA